MQHCNRALATKVTHLFLEDEILYADVFSVIKMNFNFVLNFLFQTRECLNLQTGKECEHSVVFYVVMFVKLVMFP